MPAAPAQSRKRGLEEESDGHPRTPARIDAGAALELRHLRYFVALAENLHFGRAAKALHISQPPLSRQIRDLEGYIGVPLLDRTSKSVALTEAGAAFLTEARAIVHGVSRSIQVAHRAAAGEIGNIAVAFAPFLKGSLLKGLRRAFVKENPDIKLAFHRVKSEDQGLLIRSGAIDAGLIMLPVVEDELVVEPLLRQSAVALVSLSHPVAARTEVSLRDLMQYPVSGVRDSFEVDHVGRIATMCGVPLPAGRQFASFEELLKTVEISSNVGLVPEGAREVCGAGVRCIPVRDRGADFTFALAYSRAHLPNALTKFIDVARRVNQLGD